ncbi:NUDIX hydrolase [Streptomyces anulatus]|uniref:NUDIX hydrolase n=1 Tax=Streptomyces anulatus TaxID=1892 RepID=UPI003F4A8136
MSPSSSAIRRTVEAYLDRHPDERDALAGLLSSLDRPVDATARTTNPGQITCSAVVIDQQGPATGDLIRRHTAENTQSSEPAAVPPVWDGGGQVVLNGIGVHLHIEDAEGRLLLGLRHPDSKYAGGSWHYLAGRCEQEPALACLVREAREEAGLVIDPAYVELAHVVHVVDAPGSMPLMQLVFRARRWEGTPEVREPDKCLMWRWWPQDELPDRLVSYTRTAITAIAEGRPYSEMGW